MELNENELLNALKEAKHGTTSEFVNYLQEKDHLELLADIESLLALQRQECLKEAQKEMNKLAPEILVIEQSITNAKLF